MSRKRICCVFNCQNSVEDARLYKIPPCRKRCKMWYECLEGFADISNLIPGVSVVCDKHFEKRFVTEKLRLVSSAYPSLFANDETLNGIPFKKNKRVDEENILTDHNYAHKMHNDHTYAKLATDTDFGAFKDTVPETEDVALTNYTEMANKTEIDSFYDSGAFEDPVPKTEPEVVPSCIEMSNETETTNTYISDHTIPALNRQRSRNSLSYKFNQLSPSCKRIHEEYKRVRKQASALKRALKKKKWCQKTSFEKLTKTMNPYAKKIFSMQIALSKSKTKNALRFSTEEKLFALSIMKQSPDCYRFLRQIFILPSKSTLNAMVASSKPEINPQVNDQVNNQVNDQVNDQVNGQVNDQVNDQVYNQVYNQVNDQVYNQMNNQVNNQVNPQMVYLFENEVG